MMLDRLIDFGQGFKRMSRPQWKKAFLSSLISLSAVVLLLQGRAHKTIWSKNKNRMIGIDAAANSAEFHIINGMKTVVLYTDGACKGNPGPGGYGVVLIYGARRKELSAGFRWTTNNRMELRALIEALLALKEPCRVEIVSDSKYLLDAFRKEWIPKWKRNGWRTASRQPVLNRDLWQELDQLLVTHDPHYHWVKGHGLTSENNRCDELAVAAANSKSLLIDEAYEAQNQFPGGKQAGNAAPSGKEKFPAAPSKPLIDF